MAGIKKCKDRCEVECVIGLWGGFILRDGKGGYLVLYEDYDDDWSGLKEWPSCLRRARRGPMPAIAPDNLAWKDAHWDEDRISDAIVKWDAVKQKKWDRIVELSAEAPDCVQDALLGGTDPPSWEEFQAFGYWHDRIGKVLNQNEEE